MRDTYDYTGQMDFIIKQYSPFCRFSSGTHMTTFVAVLPKFKGLFYVSKRIQSKE